MKAWQVFLQARGMAITADGAFGPQTEAATRSFQVSEGLAADGVAGKLTLGRAGLAGMRTLRRLTPKEVTVDITAHAIRILGLHRGDPYGTEIPFESGGQQYVARIEEHYHGPDDPRPPRGYHPGVSVLAVETIDPDDIEENQPDDVDQVDVNPDPPPSSARLAQDSRGAHVERWQTFLRGLDLLAVADGVFGPATHRATVTFQQRQGLTADGIVGNRTYAVAMAMGFALTEDEPARTALRPLGQAGRDRVFGKFAFVPAPTDSNPEGIRITDDWIKRSIVAVDIPQLRGIAGASSTRVTCHRLTAPKLEELFAAWERAGLMRFVLSWAGLWVPRFIRGSRTTLSSHAHGSAFDINAAWNGLGRVPTAQGLKGSVRELVPIANALGWYWGGNFSRPDGMHFELVDPTLDADTEPAPPLEVA